jgi:glycosyltransferase involved in cell wall biosynthesis
MRPHRTAYVLLWFPKDSETFIFGEVAGLRAAGLPVAVFCLYGRRDRGLSRAMGAYDGPVERLGLRSACAIPLEILWWARRAPRAAGGVLREALIRPTRGLEKAAENLWALACGFRLARRFRQERIEHIHAPWACGPATAAWAASRLTGIPFSFTARAWDIHPPDGLLETKIREAALVRSETGYNAQYLASRYCVDLERFHVTRNGAPLTGCPEAPVALRPPYRLLAVGRLVPKKGFDVLIRACAVLRGQGFDFRLVLAGDGPQRRALEALSDRLGLRERVRFLGFLPHERVTGLYARADLFLAPSVVDRTGDRDGIPTVILEALLHRLPVIAARVSGIPELIEDGVTGRLVPPGDPEALARAVARMAADRESALAMAARGRDRVREQFDMGRNTERILRLYGELLPAPGD